MSSEAISTLRLSRWVRRRASFAVVVVLPEPCSPTIMIATGGTALRSMVWPSEPSVAISSSWTIFTTIWPGVTDLTTVAPIACSRTFSVKLRTTSSETSASSSARRTSRIAASTSASVSDPRRVSRSRMPPSFSDRLSNTLFFLRHGRACPGHPGLAFFYLAPLAGRGRIALGDPGEGVPEQARAPHPNPLPARAGRGRRDRHRDDGYSKHLYARGRIALSDVDRRPRGPGGGSKRT